MLPLRGLLAAAAVTLCVEVDAASVSPLQKVITMLQDMAEKGKAEKHAEEVEFAKYQQFCITTRTETSESIAAASSSLEQLDADLTKSLADAEALSTEIADIEKTTNEQEDELKKATNIRAKEREDYMTSHTDLSESITAIEKAIAALNAKSAGVPAALLEVQTSLPKEASATISSFLNLLQAPPKAKTYEFQSSGVVKLLENLRLRFQDERLALEKTEMNNKANHEVLIQKLHDSIEANKKRIEEKNTAKAQHLQDAAAAKGDLASTKEGKVADEKKLEETKTACQTSSEEYEKNQVLRSEEIKAIQEAVSILASGDVSGAAESHLALLQVKSRKALVQLRGAPAEHQSSQILARVVSFLAERASALDSRYLSVAAAHAKSDPFVKVRSMIKDLIVKLVEQANEEADQKAYCDSELSVNKLTRDNKAADVEELTATATKLDAEAAELASQLTTLAEAIKAVRSEQAAATNLREEEKATNTKTISDAQTAQVAVQRAVKVLKDYYAKAAEAPAFVQMKSKDEFDASLDTQDDSKAPYTGMQASSTGVLGLLEVVLSDFARLEAETTQAEDMAQQSYSKFMQETKEDIAVKEVEVDHKSESQRKVTAAAADTKKELALTQEELSTALAYFDKLKPSCVDHKLSYEDRVRLRQEEIESLQEAQRILEQQDFA